MKLDDADRRGLLALAVWLAIAAAIAVVAVVGDMLTG